MEKDWVRVRSFNQRYKAEIAIEVLKDNDIQAVILDQKDSFYLMGSVEVYCPEADLAKAELCLEELK